MQITLAILRIGNIEIQEEKNCTVYKELQKCPSNVKKEDVLKKNSFEPHYSVIFHFIIKGILS